MKEIIIENENDAMPLSDGVMASICSSCATDD